MVKKLPDFSTLQRPLQEMPTFILTALEDRGLVLAYRQRPAYQQNDYLAWITRAKKADTLEKRLQQMLTELETGGIYMNMNHPGSRKNAHTAEGDNITKTG